MATMQHFDRRRIEQWRLDSNLTREQVCVRASISYSHLRAIENGQRTPTVGVLARLAAAYGRDLRELFTDPDPGGCPMSAPADRPRQEPARGVA